MRKIIIILIAAVALMAFSSGLAISRDGHEHAKKGEVINKTCPVMGGKVDKDTPYTAEYKGKKIGFCCPACIEKFNADPEKYMQEIKEKREKRKCIIKCPKCGAEVDVKKECKTQCKKGDKFCPVSEKEEKE